MISRLELNCDERPELWSSNEQETLFDKSLRPPKLYKKVIYDSMFSAFHFFLYKNLH